MMIPVSRIYKAKTADLPAVLHKLGLNLCREGRGFFVESHDSLKLFQKQGIWIYKWWSRNGEVGDGIQFLQKHYGMKFQEAVEILSGMKGDVKLDYSYGTRQVTGQEVWSSNHWQKKAAKLVDYACTNIFSSAGSESLSFLIRERCLLKQTIKEHRLGWLPAKNHMPSKLVIPCYNSRNQLIRIRFRTDNPKSHDTRYRVMKGSNAISPFPLGITPGKPVVWVESELDAVLIYQESGMEIGVIALGSASNRMNNSVCRYLINKIPINLISLDNDECGKDSTQHYLKLIPNSLSWPVPESYGKDPGEACRHMSIRKWIKDGLRQG